MDWVPCASTDGRVSVHMSLLTWMTRPGRAFGRKMLSNPLLNSFGGIWRHNTEYPYTYWVLLKHNKINSRRDSSLKPPFCVWQTLLINCHVNLLAADARACGCIFESRCLYRRNPFLYLYFSLVQYLEVWIISGCIYLVIQTKNGSRRLRTVVCRVCRRVPKVEQ